MAPISGLRMLVVDPDAGARLVIVGALVSTVTESASESAEALPIASVCLAL